MYKIYSNRIVLPDKVIRGFLTIDRGTIIQITEGQIPSDDYLDLSDKYVLPGLINLITTEYAEEISSKNNKFFSEKKIFHLMDKSMAESGVTTNYNLFNLEDLLDNQTVEDAIEQMKNIKQADQATTMIDHGIHVLFRLGDKLSNKNLREMIIGDAVDFITCTGYYPKGTFNYQNQYLAQNIQNKYELNDEETNLILEKLVSIREEIALDELSFRIKSAKSRHIPFASSRFALAEKLYDKYKIKVDIIVGEHTDETIDLMKDKNTSYGVDAVSMTKSDNYLHMLEHMKKGEIHLIMSSSRPKDIISYIFELEGTIGLIDAVNLFTKYPADVAELQDRGEIAIGKKADFVVIEMVDSIPMNHMTIKNGKTIIKYNYSRTS